nr:preprotein translocase subunit YajC [Clostridia bacterium]
MEYIKFIICVVCILLIFYFGNISNRRQNKKIKQMQNELKSGDKVITYSGLAGIIIDVMEDRVIIQTNPDNLKISIEKWAIAGIDDRNV